MLAIFSEIFSIRNPTRSDKQTMHCYHYYLIFYSASVSSSSKQEHIMIIVQFVLSIKQGGGQLWNYMHWQQLLQQPAYPLLCTTVRKFDW